MKTKIKFLMLIIVLSSLSLANDISYKKNDFNNTTITKNTSNRIIKKSVEINELEDETVSKLKIKKIVSGKKDAMKRVTSTFDFFTDSIYDVFVTPDFTTMIKLDPEENVLAIKSGDSTNFEVEQEFGGEDNAVYLFVRPTDLDVTGNLTVMTDKRVYMFNLYSTLELFNPLVKFNYPSKTNLVNNFKRNNSNNLKVTRVEDLDFDYSVSNRNLPFAPTSVYTDGTKTVITMPSDLQEAPVLLVNGEDGYEVVNYEYEMNKIIVHRKIMDAILKIGSNNKKVVNIKHK